VREPREAREDGAQPSRPAFGFGSIFRGRALISTYIGSGLQLVINGAVIVWIPSYLGRYYHLAPDRAAAVAGLLILTGGIGMMFWGSIGDRVSRVAPEGKFNLSIALALATTAVFFFAFRLPPSGLQLALVAVGMFVGTGIIGPSGALVADLTPLRLHGSAFAILATANNVIGLAPGPVLAGALADRLGLQPALQLVSLASLVAAVVFWFGRHNHAAELERAGFDLPAAAPTGAIVGSGA
jgi:MFS family permease